jgi:N-acetyl-anhydromuramoyl-L-alanine amidase
MDITGRDDWQDGWWALAQRVPSPNHGERPHPVSIDTAVIHSISLPPGIYGGPEVLQLFANKLDWNAHPYFEGIRGIEVSTHFFIRRTGAIIQCVSIDRRAWHAGVSQWMGRTNLNDFSVGIELEGLEGERFDVQQYHSLTKLCQALQRKLPLTHIVGHEHVAPGRKQDPGAGFDWSELAVRLNWGLHDVAGLHRPQAMTPPDPQNPLAIKK